MRNLLSATVPAALLFIFAGSLCIVNAQDAAYNLSKPDLIELPNELDEISGIAYGNNSVYAIHDNTGELYLIPLESPSATRRWQFSEAKDFEDVVQVNEDFYVLNSNGDIYRLRKKGNTMEMEEKFDFSFGTKNEFEILYYDPAQKKLILICKDCSGGNKSVLGSFSFDPEQKKYEKAFTINVADISAKAGGSELKFKPSAATVHPLTGEVYIVSSINKLLVTAQKDGRIKNVYPLDAALFKQPEGITFTKEGDLLISNEAADKGKANILRFRYNK